VFRIESDAWIGDLDWVRTWINGIFEVRMVKFVFRLGGTFHIE